MILMCNHGLLVMTGRTLSAGQIRDGGCVHTVQIWFLQSGSIWIYGFILVPVSGTEPAAVGPARL